MPMSIFTFLLDASVMNGYVLYQSLIGMNDLQRSCCAMMSLREFKLRIFEACVAPYVAVRQEKMILLPLNNALDDSARENRGGDTSFAVSEEEGMAQQAPLSLPSEKERIFCHSCRLRKIKQSAQLCSTLF